ncbi:MAG: hypothetical protein K2L41_07015, partial [Muribaculaceae bacterium]|nr:hypothetical protein [Muribaculaceae bacterium]
FSWDAQFISTCKDKLQDRTTIPALTAGSPPTCVSANYLASFLTACRYLLPGDCRPRPGYACT